MNSSGLTSRPGREGSDMSPTLATLIQRQGFDLDNVPADVVERALRVAEPQPLLQVRCTNPRCLAICDWSDAKGRMPKFCSSRCRQQFAQNRRRLELEIQILDSAINHQDTGPRVRRRLTRERARRMFEYSRYAGPADGTGE